MISSFFILGILTNYSMVKFNKQLLLDLEKTSKKLRMQNRDDIKDFTASLINLKNLLGDSIKSIDKELEKYSYCEKCKSYHDASDFQRLITEIPDNDPDYIYYYDVCPICGNKVFVEKKIIES